MPYKMQSNEKLYGLITDKKKYHEFVTTAKIVGLSLHDAMQQAMDIWMDAQTDQIQNEISFGTGVLGRFAKDP